MLAITPAANGVKVTMSKQSPFAIPAPAPPAIVVSARLPLELTRRLEKLAERSQRSVSATVVHLLRAAIEESERVAGLGLALVLAGVLALAGCQSASAAAVPACTGVSPVGCKSLRKGMEAYDKSIASLLGYADTRERSAELRPVVEENARRWWQNWAAYHAGHDPQCALRKERGWRVERSRAVCHEDNYSSVKCSLMTAEAAAWDGMYDEVGTGSQDCP